MCLQISGIGPAAHLQSIGVPVLHDLPGVGANLNDHYVVRISHRVRDAVSINQLARGLRLAREVARWATIGDGALTFGVTSAMVFCRSREGLASPDLQLLFTPASYAQGVFRQLEREPGMTVAVCPVRPDSRGTIMARVARPVRISRDPPELPVGAERSARADRRHPAHQADLRPAGDRALQRRRDRAGARRHDRRAVRRVRAAGRDQRLPPRRHLQDGDRPDGGRRSAAAGARHRRACASSTPRSCRR